MTPGILLCKVAGITATSFASCTAGLSVGSVLFAEGVNISTLNVLGIIGTAGGVIAVLFKMLMVSKEREYSLILKEKDRDMEELDTLKISYQKMAADALKSATAIADYYREKEGKAPLIFVPPVIPETRSPSTVKQREAAGIQTMLAHIELIKRETGQKPKTTPSHAVEATKEETR